MHRFYVEESAIDNSVITIMGQDVNHIKNVLRMKSGDFLMVCNGHALDYLCCINTITEKAVILNIESIQDTKSELPVEVYLYQGLPKKDKMELIIQKSVELGVHEVIPVFTKRTIVKLEDSKKEAKKLERWQMISESAAKQSGRGMIPQIKNVISFEEALSLAEKHDVVMIPYELADDINKTKELIKALHGKKSVGIFIGPEGGFEENEIFKAKGAGAIPVTLGNRILRTETAALMTLSFLNFELG